jgi:mitochondrial fission protein ELM1
LTRLAVDGAGLLITPSRRTPPAVVDRLAGLVTGLGGWVWPGVGENPYPAVLGLAEATVVTADSVNMACEAAVTGRPVFVSPVDRLDPKLARFHADMEAAGVTRPFDGVLAQWTYPPLREADRVAQGLAAALLGA